MASNNDAEVEQNRLSEEEIKQLSHMDLEAVTVDPDGDDMFLVTFTFQSQEGA